MAGRRRLTRSVPGNFAKKFDDMTNKEQRDHLVDNFRDALGPLIEESVRDGGFNDGCVPLWRDMVEAMEVIFKHKLLRGTRRRATGDPGEVFEGLDDEGLPPDRSDLFFRYLDALVAKFLETAGEGPWVAVIKRCHRVALESPVPKGCADLGWGRGRLLLFELMQAGELGRLANAMDGEQLRPLLYEHYGNEAVLMDGAQRKRSLVTLAGLNGLKTPIQHWSKLLAPDVAEAEDNAAAETAAAAAALSDGVSDGHGDTRRSALLQGPLLTLLRQATKGSQQEHKPQGSHSHGARSWASESGERRSSVESHSVDLTDGGSGSVHGAGGRRRSTAMSAGGAPPTSRGSSDHGSRGEGPSGTAAQGVVERLLDEHGACSTAHFLVMAEGFGDPIPVRRHEAFEVKVALGGAGKRAAAAVAWQFTVAPHHLEFSVVKIDRGEEGREHVVAGPMMVHEGHTEEGIFEAPHTEEGDGDRCMVALRWSAPKKRVMNNSRLTHRLAAVDTSSLRAAKSAALHSRVSASWAVVGAAAREQALALEKEAGGGPMLAAQALREAAQARAAAIKAGTLAVGDKALELIQMKFHAHKGDACSLCRKAFSMVFRRPHRCRGNGLGCGAYFCVPCSTHKVTEIPQPALKASAAPGAKETPAVQPTKGAASASRDDLQGKATEDSGDRLCDRCFVRLSDAAFAEATGVGEGDAGPVLTPYQELEADPALDKYFRMLRMGVQRQAVALKMIADEVPSATVATFKGEGGGGGDVTAAAADKATSSSKGVGPKGSRKAKVAGLRQVQWDVLDDAAAAKSVFGRLRGAGAGAVKAKLNVEEELRLLELFGTGEQAAAAAAAAAGGKSGKKAGGAGGGGGGVSVVDGRRANNVSIMVKQFARLVGPEADKAAAAALAASLPPLALRDDPTYAKYFKMLAMHLPKGAVAAKMSAEGVNPAVLDLDPVLPAPSPPPAPALTAAASRDARQSAAALRLAASSSSSKQPGKGSSMPHQTEAEALAQGPPYYEFILGAVLRRQACLTTERLAALADMWPTDVEAKRLASVRNLKPSQLGSDGERFMLWAATCGVSRARHKVEAALVAESFGSAADRLADDVATMSQTSLKLMGSERLRRILEHMLALGNAMNAGARDEIANAKGFTVDSLLKLCDTKTTSKRPSDKGRTLLEFFVAMVVERGEHDLLVFPRELAGLADAALKSDAIVVGGDVKQLANEVRKVQREHASAAADAAAIAAAKEAAAKAKRDRTEAKRVAKEKAEAEAKARRLSRQVVLAKLQAMDLVQEVKGKVDQDGAVLKEGLSQAEARSCALATAAAARVKAEAEAKWAQSNLSAAKASGDAKPPPPKPPLPKPPLPKPPLSRPLTKSEAAWAAAAKSEAKGEAKGEVLPKLGAILQSAPAEDAGPHPAEAWLSPFFDADESLPRGLKKFIAEFGPKQSTALRSALAPAVGSEPPLALRDDPTYAKYFKMLAMHLPKGAVAAKMSAEGVDPAVLDLDPALPAPIPPPPLECRLLTLATFWLAELEPPQPKPPAAPPLPEPPKVKPPMAAEVEGAAKAAREAKELASRVEAMAGPSFLAHGEKVVVCGMVSKRGSMAHDAYLKRVLVLTDRQRLAYLTPPPKVELKGAFKVGPWSAPTVTSGGARFEVTEDNSQTIEADDRGLRGSVSGLRGSVSGGGPSAAPVPAKRGGLLSGLKAFATSTSSSSSSSAAAAPLRTYFFSVDFYEHPSTAGWVRAIEAAATGKSSAVVLAATSDIQLVAASPPAAAMGAAAGAAAGNNNNNSAPVVAPDVAKLAGMSQIDVKPVAASPAPQANAGRANFLLEIQNTKKPKAAGTGGRGDLLAQIAARGQGKAGVGPTGSTGNNSDDEGEATDGRKPALEWVDEGPMVADCAFFQESLGAFLATSGPKLQSLEEDATEMQGRCKAMCEYFGAGPAGSSAAVFGSLAKFTAALAAATSSWERKNKTTLDHLLDHSEGSSTASGDVSVGHVVATAFGAGVVEAVRNRDQVCVVRLDSPPASKVLARLERAASTDFNGSARAFLQVSAIATLGASIFSPFGPGTVTGRAEAPISMVNAVEVTGRRRSMATDRDATNDNEEALALPMAPRYTVQLSWGVAYLQPRDVRLSKHSVNPSARVAHRVWSLADIAAAKKRAAEAAAAEVAAEAERRREAERRTLAAEASVLRKAEEDAAAAAAENAAMAAEEATATGSSELSFAAQAPVSGSESGAAGAVAAAAAARVSVSGRGSMDSAQGASSGSRSSINPPPLFGVDGDGSESDSDSTGAQVPVSVVSTTWAPKSLYDDDDDDSDEDDDEDTQPRESMFHSGVRRSSASNDSANEESFDNDARYSTAQPSTHGAVEEHEFDDL